MPNPNMFRNDSSRDDRDVNSNAYLRLLRLDDLKDKLAISRSAIYKDMRNGTLPPQIHPTGRTAAWPESEIDTIIRARLRGCTDDEIRGIVSELVKRRYN